MAGGRDCDVLVVGLGPVGALLALLLGRRGISVIAIDRAEGIYELPRAAVVDDEVLRVFQEAGVVERVMEEAQIQEEVKFVTARGRKVRFLNPVAGNQGHPPLVSINQPALERSLAAGIAETPSVEVRRGCSLKRFDQDGEGVTAHLRSSTGVADTVRARYLVGTDGGGSLVRRLLGIEFGGSTFRQRWLVVDVHVDRPLAKVPHPHFYGDWRRPIVSLPMSPGRHRWEWMLHPGEDEAPFLEPGSLRERIDPWLDGQNVEIERAVVYTFHARTASRWRDGRVFLAGDAAHVMPPFVGQGFSSGARDALNLAWKLEAVLRGAPDGLLDAYEAERRTHVRSMTRLALTLGGLVQTTDRRVAAVRDAYLNFMEWTGIARWLEERIKPVPAYGRGAFAEQPHRLPPKRGVGSQFPQPLVRAGGAGGEELLLDELIGPGWSAVATDVEAAKVLGAEGLRTLVVGRDFGDPDGVITEWLDRFESDWVVLRPDRFAFALGSGAAAVPTALAALHGQVWKTAEHAAT